MIETFKNFSKKKFAGLLLIIVIIIAFGFGGFGGGFKSSSQNNIAKINNTNILTQDFMDYLNESGLSQQVIKTNLDKNILEELLSTLVSKKLLDLEIKDLDLIITKNALAKKIKKNKNFQDLDGKFQRTLYEKFLLTESMSAQMYEIKLKNNLMQKQLFTYISGGAKSPKFLVDKYYKENNKKLDVAYISLDTFYKKKDKFTEQDIKKFVKENSDKLKQDYIDFSYVIITPKNLTGLDNFNQTFFDKIDDIENKISKNINFDLIVNELGLKQTTKKDYLNLENKETVENKIYNSRGRKVEILEDNGTYIFYNIIKSETKLPKLNNIKFIEQVKNLLFQKEKFEFNKNILNQLDTKEFNQISFDKLAINGVNKIRINSIKDNEKFETNSVEVLYSMPVNNFTLIANDKDQIFVAKVIGYEDQNLLDNSDQFKGISNEASAQNRNSILKSYDFLLNSKYKVVINEKTLDRVKNYFR